MASNTEPPFPTFITRHPEGIVLRIVVSPRAKRSAFVGLYGGVPRVAIAAPPADGRANEEVIALLADLFEISKKSVQLLRGASSRHKSLLIQGISAEQALRAFNITRQSS